MRTIKFRGKSTTKYPAQNISFGDWVYGSYVQSGVDAPCIIFGDGEQCEIDQETLGQYTGLLDKNGKGICKDDLCNVFYTSGDGENIHDCIYKVSVDPLYGLTLKFVKLLWESSGYNQYPLSTTLSSQYDKLEYSRESKGNNCIAVRDTWGENPLRREKWKQNDYSNYIEVIGNIYENGDLLND